MNGRIFLDLVFLQLELVIYRLAAIVELLLADGDPCLVLRLLLQLEPGYVGQVAVNHQTLLVVQEDLVRTLGGVDIRVGWQQIAQVEYAIDGALVGDAIMDQFLTVVIQAAAQGNSLHRVEGNIKSLDILVRCLKN